MDITYLLVAAAIVLLPFVLTRLLSGSGDTDKVLGAEPRSKRLVPQARTASVQSAARVASAPAPAAAGAARGEKPPHAGAGGLQPVSSALRLSRELGPKVVELLKTGQKIEAIKLIRAHAGVDLKTAKDIVDRLAP